MVFENKRFEAALNQFILKPVPTINHLLRRSFPALFADTCQTDYQQSSSRL